MHSLYGLSHPIYTTLQSMEIGNQKRDLSYCFFASGINETQLYSQCLEYDEYCLSLLNAVGPVGPVGKSVGIIRG